MALTVNTSNPTGLLRKIKAAIDARAVRAWSYDGDGDFTHNALQWKHQAWLRPIAASGALHFEIVLPKGDLKEGVEGVYYGRFGTMLLNHFSYTAIETSTTRQIAHIDAHRAATAPRRTRATANRRARREVAG